MPEYRVSVNFLVEANNADAAQKVVKDEIKSIKSPKIHVDHVNQGCLTNLNDPEIKISEKMLDFFAECIRDNEYDVSGYDTDLDYVNQVLVSREEENNKDYVTDTLYTELRTELDNLLKKIGLGTQVANLLHR